MPGGVVMVRTFLLCCALLGSQGASDEKTPARTSTDLAGYQEATAKAGKTADAQIRLALWCEAHGLTAERLKHLSLAVLYDPSNTLARGLMGLVAYHGKWDRPDVVGQQIQNDPAHQAIVKEYLDRRARTPEKAEAQFKLAAWCEQNGLKEQAMAHYSVVTRLDPSREAAWKHLGYKKQGGRWVKPEEAAAAKQEAAHQKVADKHWKTKLEKLRDGLESKDAAKRAKAEHGLTEVTDPRAVPMIWAIFVRGGERQQIAAVQMLSQIDGPSASNGLAVLAVFSPRRQVRRRATDVLKRRDPRDVVGKLIGLIHKPYKYQVRHVDGRESPGELFVEGERFNIQRFYYNQITAPILNLGRLYTPDVPFDPFNLGNLMLATIPSFATGPVGRPSTVASFPYPVSPYSAALAGQAIAADPQNASAILGQLVNDPGNRFAPPGYWFFPGQANGVSRATGAGKRSGHSRPKSGDSGSDAESVRSGERRRNQPASVDPTKSKQPAASSADRETPRDQSRESTGWDCPRWHDGCSNLWPCNGTLRSAKHSSRSARLRRIWSKCSPWTCSMSKRSTRGSSSITTAHSRYCKRSPARTWVLNRRNGRAGGSTRWDTPTNRICRTTKPTYTDFAVEGASSVS